MSKLFDKNNIIFIDEKVSLNHYFIDSCKTNTHAIMYNKNTRQQDLLNKISEISMVDIDRIGFVFDEIYLNNNIFVNNKPFFTDRDLEESDIDKLSSNFKFLIYLCTAHNIKNIDFLVCNSLNYKKPEINDII